MNCSFEIGIPRMTEIGQAPFPRKLAKAVSFKVYLQAGAMLKGSSLVGCEWHKKDEAFGLFEKNELQLGDLLGTGGFSDVHEICGFTENDSVKCLWNIKQSLSRKYYRDSAIDQRGKAKYVVKHLKKKMLQNPDKFSIAASDLVVEAQLLSSLNHENILKVRGWAAGGISSYKDGYNDSYFLILDRLDETLDLRIEKWKMEIEVNETFQRLSLRNDENSTNSILSRIKVAHQIACGLRYLHSKNIIFRDLKPNNVGIDSTGTVKIFDFGLARELPQKCQNINDIYSMSGMIGTLRYMAPECAYSKPYNQKVDTYSWAQLFWSCLALKKPHENMTRTIYLTNVCRHGERPALDSCWPNSVQKLLQKSWAHDPFIRLTMLEVCAYLERIEEELSPRPTDELLSKQTTKNPSSLAAPLIIQKVGGTLTLPLIQQTRCLAQ